jgi:hypothetical protein
MDGHDCLSWGRRAEAARELNAARFGESAGLNGKG